MSTKERLARDLEAAHAPALMIRKAREGQYDDDFESESPTPIIDLVGDCLKTGMASLRLLADEAKRGAYDGTREEGAAWMQREGNDLLHGRH